MSTTDPLKFIAAMSAAEQIEFSKTYYAGDLPDELAQGWREYCAAERARIAKKNDADFARIKKLITGGRTAG